MAEVEESTFENFEEAPIDDITDSAVVAADVDEDNVLAPAYELPEIKLFGRWGCDDVHVADMSLAVCFPFITCHTLNVLRYLLFYTFIQDYIAVKEKYARYTPHSAGRYAAKRFRKAQCPIVERLTNALMMKGRSNGKKLLAMRIVKHAFEIIHLLTDQNPLQVVVTAIINSGPREDSTRIGRAGTVRRQAVDVSPLRRVNQVRIKTTNMFMNPQNY